MKNIGKIVGIIAILAVIGFMAGCQLEVDPDDQVSITVNSLPNGANGLFTLMYLSSNGVDYDIAITSALRGIFNGSTTNNMKYPPGHKNEGKAFGEEGNYYVILAVYDSETPSSASTPKYTGRTTDKVKITKGGNIVAASKFTPTISDSTFPTTPTPPVGKPPSAFYGTYTGNGAKAGTTETIELTETTFKISDDEKAPPNSDFLTFVILDWADAAVPSTYSEYTKGYKFTGYIGDGRPNETYIYGTQTAPSFNQSDITNKTRCHMYIYTKGEGTSFTFIRTVFSKESGTDNTTAITNGTAPNTTLRVFTKK